MRILVQRVTKATVHIEQNPYAQIKNGLVVFVGIEHEDDELDADYLASKCSALRVFDDKNDKMNLSVNDAHGSLLVISQFTLHAMTRKGNRPSFMMAAKPEKAKALYEYFIRKMNSLVNSEIKTGIFGANMQVELINNGPVTILIDSKNKE
ncbi:D-aminoacyl-tRNA deacylase [Crocinitomicaceae bacterium]|nr:D-aminoacyl-tRNA deacylase [Crocinitomicaceae bacterium]